MRTRMVTALMVVALAAGAAACGEDEARGQPVDNGAPDDSVSSQQPQQPGGDSALPHSGAPAVESPIDTSQWEGDPCAVIADDDFVDAGFEQPRPEPEPESNFGPTCHWPGVAELSSAGGMFFTSVTQGLSHFYAKNEAGDFEYFEELDPIEEYPAVALIEGGGGTSVCTVDVGVRDELVYSATVDMDSSSDWHDDPCGAAEKIAELAMQTMTEGG